jgi:hypothetical protein
MDGREKEKKDASSSGQKEPQDDRKIDYDDMIRRSREWIKRIDEYLEKGKEPDRDPAP